MLTIRDLNIDSPSVLAPMAGVTDLAFRRLARELGCAMAYTEFVSADGVVRGGRGSFDLLRTAPWDHPLGVQLFGSDAATIAEAAAIVVERTGCDVLDLNMGCWVPKVIKRGAGAAILKDPKKAEQIVRAVVEAVRIPVTAKIRAGWCSTDINAPEVARAIEAGGASALTLHARTRAQAHSGEADWSLIKHLKEILSIPVMGNGGVREARDVVRMLAETGCDAAMIGRAGLSNPWIFAQAADAFAGREVREPSSAERLSAVERLLRYEVELKGEERRAVLALRSQLCRFTAGFHGAVHFRRKLEQIDSIDSALSELAPVFSSGDPHFSQMDDRVRRYATSA